MTITIMGIALVPMMMSVATASSTSDYLAQRSAAEGYATQVADLVRSQKIAPQVCAAPGKTLLETYDAQLQTALAAAGDESTDFDVAVTGVTVTDTPAETASVDPSAWAATCHGNGKVPNLTWVEVTVTSKSDSSVTATASTVQRKQVVT